MEIGSKEHEDWLAKAPKIVQETFRLWPPTQHYKDLTTGQVVLIKAYGSNGELQVFVVPGLNGPLSSGTSLQGVRPRSLVPLTEEYERHRREKFAFHAPRKNVVVVKGGPR